MSLRVVGWLAPAVAVSFWTRDVGADAPAQALAAATTSLATGDIVLLAFMVASLTMFEVNAWVRTKRSARVVLQDGRPKLTA